MAKAAAPYAERYTPIKLKLINTHNISKLLNKYAPFSGVCWQSI